LEKKKESEERRDYLKTVGALVAGLAVGGAAAWLGKPAERVEVPGPTVPGPTVTKTAPGPTVTVTAPPTPKKIKLAGMGVGPRDDLAWVQVAWEGMQKAKEQYGAEIAFSEMVSPPEYEKVFRDYAALGYDVIAGFGFMFAEPAWAVADEYPEITFVYTCTPDYPPVDNVVAPIYQEQEGGAVVGVAMGLMTKTNKVGVVIGDVGPCCNSFAHGIAHGLKLVNPDATLLVVYAGAWADPAKGKDLAMGMIEAGADVLTHYADGTGLGVITAAKEKGIYWVGCFRDQSELAPDSCLGSYVTDHWEFMKQIMEAYLRGQLKKPWIFRADFNSGISRWAPGPAIPNDVQEKVEKFIYGMITNKPVPRDESKYVE